MLGRSQFKLSLHSCSFYIILRAIFHIQFKQFGKNILLNTTLPDITSHSSAEISSTLQWVGMEKVAVPISVNWQVEQFQTIPAKADIYVNLEKPDAKGIHMSRLHLAINKLAELDCNKSAIESLLDEVIHSQSGISSAAKINLSFDVLLEKPALLSDEKGYQTYPVTISAEKLNDRFYCEFEVTIPYSSTCPCSAALARQLYANAVDETFAEGNIDKATLLKWIESTEGSIATPHSQRSFAYIKFSVDDNNWPDLPQFIFFLESVIGTPVQTAVKRNDEQEFAKLNAKNLMFCEDAARRVKKSLEQMDVVEDYWFKIEHQESLHAHNAVVIDQRKNSRY